MGHFEKGRWVEDAPRSGWNATDMKPVRVWWTGKPGEPGEWIETPESMSDIELKAAANRCDQERRAYVDRRLCPPRRVSLFERIMRYFRR